MFGRIHRRRKQRRCRYGWRGPWQWGFRSNWRFQPSYGVQRVISDEVVERIYELLPKANCGKCGYESCYDAAVAIAEGRAPPDVCRVVGNKVAGRIREILGG